MHLRRGENRKENEWIKALHAYGGATFCLLVAFTTRLSFSITRYMLLLRPRGGILSFCFLLQSYQSFPYLLPACLELNTNFSLIHAIATAAESVAFLSLLRNVTMRLPIAIRLFYMIVPTLFTTHHFCYGSKHWKSDHVYLTRLYTLAVVANFHTNHIKFHQMLSISPMPTVLATTSCRRPSHTKNSAGIQTYRS